MTEALERNALMANNDDNPAEAALVWRLTDGLPDDLPETRNYRRLLEDALKSASEARAELTDARRRIAVLEHQSRTDEVTGLLNRRGFEIAFEAALARVRRFGEAGVLVIVDLDGFKQINDTHGHAAGDLVLANVGAVLTRHTRDVDSVARIGGDEFAVILTAASEDGAKTRVRTLDRLLNYASVRWEGQEIPIRASFGAAPYGPDDSPVGVFAKADAAMYQRKGSAARS